MTPTKYKSITWVDIKKKKIFFGVDALIVGEWHHVKEGRKKLFYDERKDAIKKVKELNKEIKANAYADPKSN
jgi:hypothetical protein